MKHLDVSSSLIVSSATMENHSGGSVIYSPVRKKSRGNKSVKTKYICDIENKLAAPRESTSSGYISLDDVQSIASDEVLSTVPLSSREDKSRSTGSTDDSYVQNYDISDKTFKHSCNNSSLDPSGTAESSQLQPASNWEKRCYQLEENYCSLTSKLIKKEEELFLNELELRQMKLILQAEQRKLLDIEEHRNQLSNCVSMINNIVFASETDHLCEKIYGILKGVDIIGSCENNNFGENIRTSLAAQKEQDLNSYKVSFADPFSSDYLRSGYEETTKVNIGSRGEHPDKRRHSVAITPQVCTARAKKDPRRSSMVIRTTLQLGPEGLMEEHTRIDSINLGSNNSIEEPLYENCNVQQQHKRYLAQPIPRHTSSPIPRRQSCNFANISRIQSSESSQLLRRQSLNVPNINRMDSTDNKRFCVFSKYHDKCDANSVKEDKIEQNPSVITSKIENGRSIPPRRERLPSLLKEHSFQKKNFIVIKKCYPCGHRIKLGRAGFKCTDCAIFCHLECMHNVPLPCHLQEFGKQTLKNMPKNYFQSPPLLDTNE